VLLWLWCRPAAVAKKKKKKKKKKKEKKKERKKEKEKKKRPFPVRWGKELCYCQQDPSCLFVVTNLGRKENLNITQGWSQRSGKMEGQFGSCLCRQMRQGLCVLISEMGFSSVFKGNQNIDTTKKRNV